MKKIVDFAVERNLYLHAHCDEEALLILFSHNPTRKIIWAHTGFSTEPARVKELFAKYPALWGELSFRNGITGSDGKLIAGMARPVCAAFRPLPARLRHLDQRALVRL